MAAAVRIACKLAETMNASAENSPRSNGAGANITKVPSVKNVPESELAGPGNGRR
jgi:hypothetical protein